MKRVVLSNRVNLVVLSIVVVFAAAFLASEAYAASIKVTVTGAIKKGVSVQVSGGGLAAAVTKKTSKDGLVKFTNLALGTYVVLPSKSNYSFSPEINTLILTADRTYKTSFKATKLAKLVGVAKCFSCHKSSTPEVYAGWLPGPHGNFNFMDDTTHQIMRYSNFLASFVYPTDAVKFVGYPNATTIAAALKEPAYAGKTEAYCLGCHGPSTKDNTKIAGMPLVQADGTLDTAKSTQVGRPVVGCEMCHGGGEHHVKDPVNNKPASFTRPSVAKCGNCHDKDFPSAHLADHPAGAGGVGNPGIYEDYLASKHVQSLESAIYTDPKKKKVTALCSKCHTDQGARKYWDTNGDATTLPAALAGEPQIDNPGSVQCRTCHDAHNPGDLLNPATGSFGNVGPRSAQFNTCTNCHQLLTSTDGKIAPYHATKNITGTHYDDPATQEQEGINVNKASDSACANCHNPHSTDTTINKRWIESGHADFKGAPWTEDDWKDNGNPNATPPTFGQQACQRCHTATGYINRLKDPATYDANVTNHVVNNDYSYLTGLQNEVLYCNACHTDSAFNRRTISPVGFPSGLTADMGDDSNLCMACHQGRNSKVQIDAKVAGGPPPYTFTNIHYFAASASLFGTDVKGGYEYNGNTYEGRNKFTAHNGKRDTCVKCHAREGSAEFPDHHFKPEVKDCSGCHTGITDFGDIRPGGITDWDGDGSTTEGLKGEIEGLRAALYTAIRAYAEAVIVPTNAGWYICYDSVGASGQYFFKDVNNNGVKDADETQAYNKFDAKLLEAAYNYQVSTKEPCGHIHNAKYIGQLLYDSIKDLGGDAAVATLKRPE